MFLFIYGNELLYGRAHSHPANVMFPMASGPRPVLVWSQDYSFSPQCNIKPNTGDFICLKAQIVLP